MLEAEVDEQYSNCKVRFSAAELGIISISGEEKRYLLVKGNDRMNGWDKYSPPGGHIKIPDKNANHLRDFGYFLEAGNDVVIYDDVSRIKEAIIYVNNNTIPGSALLREIKEELEDMNVLKSIGNAPFRSLGSYWTIRDIPGDANLLQYRMLNFYEIILDEDQQKELGEFAEKNEYIILLNRNQLDQDFHKGVKLQTGIFNTYVDKAASLITN